MSVPIDSIDFNAKSFVLQRAISLEELNTFFGNIFNEISQLMTLSGDLNSLNICSLSYPGLFKLLYQIKN